MNEFILYAIIGVLCSALLLVIFWPELKKLFGAKVSPTVSAELDREHFDLSDWWRNQADPMLKKMEERIERLIVRANSVIATNLATAATNAGAVPPSAVASPPPVSSPGVGPAAPAVVSEATAAPSAVGETPPPAAKPATMEKSMEADKGIVSAGQLLSGWVLPDDYATPPVQGVAPRRHADLMYLWQMSRKPGGNMVFEDVITGTQEQVNVCKMYVDTIGQIALISWNADGSPKDWSTDPGVDPAIKTAAEASVAAWFSMHPRDVHKYDLSRYHTKA